MIKEIINQDWPAEVYPTLNRKTTGSVIESLTDKLDLEPRDIVTHTLGINVQAFEELKFVEGPSIAIPAEKRIVVEVVNFNQNEKFCRRVESEHGELDTDLTPSDIEYYSNIHRVALIPNMGWAIPLRTNKNIYHPISEQCLIKTIKLRKMALEKKNESDLHEEPLQKVS